MTALRREQILGASDLPRTQVEVPEWGGHLFVRSMSGVERDAWEAGLIGDGSGPRNLENVRARLVVLCAVDEDGKRLFDEDDAPALGRKSAAALDRVFQVAMRVNALSRQEVDRLAGE